jgi:cytochrome c-type biogenesis protein CcmH
VLVAVPVLRNNKAAPRSSLLSLAVLLIGLPLATLYIFNSVSTYPWDNPDAVMAPAANAPAAVAEMVSGLEARMATEPTIEGMAMLGRSYTTLQRYEDAVEAWHSAWEMSEGQAPGITLSYAEALILADRSTLTTSAADLLDTALEAFPNNPTALWYGGMSALARGDQAQMAARWGRLLNNPEIPDQLRLVVQEQLAAIGAQPVAAGSATTQSATAAENTNSTAIAVTISISDELAGQAGRGSTLFLIARESGRPGPPVAVRRMSVRSFPFTTTLSDANVMIAGNSLGKIKKLLLIARISGSGNAIAATGDLYGEASPPAGTASATVVINQIK